jgi:hypothetical protein
MADDALAGGHASVVAKEVKTARPLRGWMALNETGHSTE